MKKISLKNLNLNEVDQLSREQLKNVLGGWNGATQETGGQTGGGSCQCDTNCFVMTSNTSPDCDKVCEGLNNSNCYD